VKWLAYERGIGGQARERRKKEERREVEGKERQTERFCSCAIEGKSEKET